MKELEKKLNKVKDPSLLHSAKKEIIELILLKWFLMTPANAEAILALDEDLKLSEEIKIILELIKQKEN